MANTDIRYAIDRYAVRKWRILDQLEKNNGINFLITIL